jgi:NTE family protein
MKEYNHLIIDGGGLLGFCYIGGIKYLLDHNHLKHVVKYTGTSIGSLICIGLVMDLDIEQLISFLKQNEFINKKDINLYTFIDKFGLDNGQRFRNMLFKLDDRFSLTLKELYDITNKEVNIKTANLSQMTSTVMNHSTYPNVQIIDAVYMSCCIPILFAPIKYEDEMHVDGYILSNRSNCISDSDECINIKCIHSIQTKSKTNSLFAYLIKIIECIIMNLQNQRDHTRSNVKIISIINKKYPIISYQYMEFIDDMIQYGYEETSKQFKVSSDSLTKEEEQPFESNISTLPPPLRGVDVVLVNRVKEHICLI